jgi:hypothetical protein
MNKVLVDVAATDWKGPIALLNKTKYESCINQTGILTSLGYNKLTNEINSF